MNLNKLIQDVENKLLEIDPNHEMSFKHIKSLYEANKITGKQYNLSTKINKIMFILYSIDFKPLVIDCDSDKLGYILSFTDLADDVMDGIEVPKTINMSLNDVITLINEYMSLQKQLIALG